MDLGLVETDVFYLLESIVTTVLFDRGIIVWGFSGFYLLFSEKTVIDATAYKDISGKCCSQLCGKSLGKVLSCTSMTAPLSKK